jgi:large subunit ribosomal protein L9
MEVILQEDFVSLGFVGDKIQVKAGYARNFLIPRGIAVEASSRDAKALRHRLGVITAKKQKLKAEADEHRRKVESTTLVFSLKAGSGNKGFGSITAKDIEEKLASQGIVIDRRVIKLVEPLKTAGEYRIAVKLHSDVVAQLPVTVELEGAKAEGKSD